MQETAFLDLGRSPEAGNGNSLQYPCLENSMDRGTWWAIVHRVPESHTRLKRLSTHVNSWLFRAKLVTGRTSCSLIQQAFNWTFKSLLFKFPGDSDANRYLSFPFFFFFLHSTQDFSFPTRDGTQAPVLEAQSPNHWTVREFPQTSIWEQYLKPPNFPK